MSSITFITRLILINSLRYWLLNLNKLQFSFLTKLRNPLWLVSLICSLSFVIWQQLWLDFTSKPLLQLEDTDMAETSNFTKQNQITVSQLGFSDNGKVLPVSGLDSNTILAIKSVRSLVIEVATQDTKSVPHLQVTTPWPAPRIIPIEELPAAYRGPAPELEVLGH